jgi:PKD repeat protein
MAAIAVSALLPASQSRAAERKYLVTLANSPKQYPGPARNPRFQPTGGLINKTLIDRQYFDQIDPNIGSFAEYWEEISYGDVTISGQVTDWVSLPWSIQAPLVNDADDTPENGRAPGAQVYNNGTNFFDASNNGMYEYGRGEPFDNTRPRITVDLNGALPNGQQPGSNHVSGTFGRAVGADAGNPVWKPGERFVDVNNNGRWDGLDEANNWGDNNGDMQPDLQGPWIDLNLDGEGQAASNCIYLPDADNDGFPDCCPNGPGTVGCESRFMDDGSINPDACLPLVWDHRVSTDFPQFEFRDGNGNMIPDFCDADCLSDECADSGWTSVFPGACGGSRDELPFVEVEGQCVAGEPNGTPDELEFLNYAENCVGSEITDVENPCFGFPVCEPRPANEPVVNLRPRCEMDDRAGGDRDGNVDVVEPFENFMRRWDPCLFDPDVDPGNANQQRSHWIKVFDPTSGGAPECTNPAGGAVYAAFSRNPDPMAATPSYIENNYPGDFAALENEALSRVIFGVHDPLQIGDPAACMCDVGVTVIVDDMGVPMTTPDGFPMLGISDFNVPCADLDFDGDGTPEVTGACFAGIHSIYNSPDAWTNVTPNRALNNLPIRSSKMKAVGGTGGEANFVIATPEPGSYPPFQPVDEPWWAEAWSNRYEVPSGETSPPRAWPAGSSGLDPSANTLRMAEFNTELDPENWVPERDRRIFSANFGGTTLLDPVGTQLGANQHRRRIGLGTGWSMGIDGGGAFSANIWENGTPEADSFLAGSGEYRILPEEAGGAGQPGVYYDGPVEHDDLPKSKYHRAGDQRLGEVTSPFNKDFWGQDFGTHELNSTGPSNGDQIIPGAGPLAVGVHGTLGRDAGNMLLPELLTWVTDGSTVSFGHVWDSLHGPHPFAGPGDMTTPGENMGFRDYNLDGMVDQGESRIAGTECYLVDGDDASRDNGTDTAYPWNRQRLTEDVIHVVDEILDFDDFVDAVSMARLACPGTTTFSSVPIDLGGMGPFDSIPHEGVVSGITLLPAGAHVPGDFIRASPVNYPIHNNDAGDPLSKLPRDPNRDHTVNWNIAFHDLIISMGVEGESAGAGMGTIPTADFQTAYSAHEYLHSWEGFPDLYDYDVYFTQANLLINRPIARWCIMAEGGLVHPVPILKEKPCTEWIRPVDLATVLTPGVRTTLTLPRSEFVRDQSHFFLENENWLGERYYLWSVGSGFNTRMPGPGMLIMHTDVGANAEALPSGQQNATRFNYMIVEADGRGELAAGENGGEASDPWPGSENKRVFNFNTFPAATWYAQNSWTGLSISDVRPDGNGSVAIDITWSPTSIPSFEFIDPPGGQSVLAPDGASIYDIRGLATDVFGGTLIRFFWANKPETVSCSAGDSTACFGHPSACVGGQCTNEQDFVPPYLSNADSAHFVGSMLKVTPGTHPVSFSWNINNLSDGRYFLFAELIPGPGADGDELSATAPRKNRNNVGNGTMTDVTVKTTQLLGGGLDGEVSELVFTDAAADFTVDDIDQGDRIRIIAGSGVETGDCDLYDIWQVDGQRLAIVGGDDPRSAGATTHTITEYQILRPRQCGNGEIPECFDPPNSFDFNCYDVVVDAPAAAATVTGFNSFKARPNVDFVADGIQAGDQLMVGGFATRIPIMRVVQSVAGNGRTLELTSGPQNSPLLGGPLDNWNVQTWSVVRPGKSRSESWTATSKSADGRKWVVTSSITEDVPASTTITTLPTTFCIPAGVTSFTYPTDATTCPGDATFSAADYTRRQNTSPVTFKINLGSLPFGIGDSFTFVTTGATAVSQGVTVVEGVIKEGPTAIIDATPLSGLAPLTVTFDGRASIEPDGLPLDYFWTFDDGTTATGDVVVHTFNQSRPFTVVLRVTNPVNGLFHESFVDIDVTNNSPTAKVVATPTSGPRPLTVNLSGAQSSDLESGTAGLIYRWDFGDGQTAGTGIPGDLVDTSHFYDADGPFNVVLTVEDAGGKTATDTVQILVGNTRPVPNVFFTSPTGSSPLTVTFNAINSFDADGDAIMVTWMWGDGSPNETYPRTGKPPAVNGAVPHTFTLAANETSRSFNVTALLTDARGATATWPGVTVTVNKPTPAESVPFADFTITPADGVVNETITFDASLSRDNPPSGTLTAYNWDFGDGTTGTGKIIEHKFELPGTYNVRLTVVDNATPPNTASRTRSIIIRNEDGTGPDDENSPPTAVFVVNPSSGVAGVTRFSLDASASSDPDGDELTYLWSLGDGKTETGVRIEHVYDTPGAYLVRLTVRDAKNASTDATRQVLVSDVAGNNVPFAFITAGPRTGTAPVVLLFNGSTSFDPDGDPLTYTWEFKVDGEMFSELDGAEVTQFFEEAGTYTVELVVDDGKGGVGRSGEEQVVVTARQVIDNGNGNGNTNDNGEGQPIPPPESGCGGGGGLCGLGMIISLLGSLTGLTALKAGVRRRRR